MDDKFGESGEKVNPKKNVPKDEKPNEEVIVYEIRLDKKVLVMFGILALSIFTVAYSIFSLNRIEVEVDQYKSVSGYNIYTNAFEVKIKE